MSVFKTYNSGFSMMGVLSESTFEVDLVDGIVMLGKK